MLVSEHARHVSTSGPSHLLDAEILTCFSPLTMHGLLSLLLQVFAHIFTLTSSSHLAPPMLTLLTCCVSS